MNKTEQAQQLRLAAELIETGHPWERYSNGRRWIKSELPVAMAVSHGDQIRPILATPPDNRPLHNPDNLTAEQVGLGYRLTLPGEWNPTQEYWHCTKQWKKAERLSKLDTFRLPLSVPWPAIPDPYAELKAAHAAGKVIQWKFKDAAGWMDKLANFEEFPGNCDFRIKPEPPAFQLPPPPPGMRWHRKDGWNEDDLPQGYRPLMDGEIVKAGDEVKNRGMDGGTFIEANNYVGYTVGATFDGQKGRTTRPLVFTYEGKEWTYHKPGDPMPCEPKDLVEVVDGELCDSGRAELYSWDARTTILGWRYAETTKTVKLGPEDVPPFSVIRRKNQKQAWHWRLLSYVHGTHAICVRRGYTWTELACDYEINRSIPLTGRWNPDAWEPCSKAAQIEH